MSKKIVIVGGGVSGLTAGIYAQLNGYDSLILEKNPVLGGLCTGWNRKGRYIDGCIHWLTGVNKELHPDLYDIWETTGAINNELKMTFLPTWGSFEYEGVTVTFDCDLDKAEASWIKISPNDKKMIKHFFKMVRKIASFNLPLKAPALLLPWKEKFFTIKNLIRTFPYYTKGMFISCDKFASKFKHPALRWALTHAQPGAGNLYCMMFSYATVASKNGGIPEGGSAPLIERMKNRYLSLGGNISLNSEVVSVDINKKEIVNLTLKNGNKVCGDYYVMCCDSNYVLINLLNNKYTFPKLAERYNNPKVHPAPSCVLINYEVPILKDVNIPFCYQVNNYQVAEKNLDYITARSFQYDETYNKDDKTILQILIDQDSNDYDWWLALRQNPAKYQQYKQELADFIQKELENKVPEFKGNMTLLDVATPITLNRYTNASRGSYMSFLFNHKKGVIASSGRVVGINNLYLSGQYMNTPGGLPLAAASGKFSIQWIMNRDIKLLFKIFNLYRV